MAQETGMIIEAATGHKEHCIFGKKICSETPDTFSIVRHNSGTFPFLNYKWIGKFKAGRPNQYRQRDIVAVTIDDVDTKKILAITQIGKESGIRHMLHDVHFIAMCALGVVFVILRLINII